MVHVSSILAGAGIVKVVRDCPAARWFPSRHRFAVWRLVAFLWSVSGHRQECLCHEGIDHLVLAIDRDQSAIEHYTVSIFVVVTISCYFAAFLPVVVAVPVAALSIQLVVSLGGLVVGGPGERSLRRNSILLWAWMTGASAYFALATSLVRYVAWFFFAVLFTNAVAWLLMFFLRDSVQKLEERCES